MLDGIYKKTEKLTALVGRYCDLDRAARWRKAALIAGTVGWAGRWTIVAFLAYDMVSEASAETIDAAPADSSSAMTAIAWGAAIGACMILKWAGWTYGGVGYVHHRSKNRT